MDAIPEASEDSADERPMRAIKDGAVGGPPGQSFYQGRALTPSQGDAAVRDKRAAELLKSGADAGLEKRTPAEAVGKTNEEEGEDWRWESSSAQADARGWGAWAPWAEVSAKAKENATKAAEAQKEEDAAEGEEKKMKQAEKTDSGNSSWKEGDWKEGDWNNPWQWKVGGWNSKDAWENWSEFE